MCWIDFACLPNAISPNFFLFFNYFFLSCFISWIQIPWLVGKRNHTNNFKMENMSRIWQTWAWHYWNQDCLICIICFLYYRIVFNDKSLSLYERIRWKWNERLLPRNLLDLYYNWCIIFRRMSVPCINSISCSKQASQNISHVENWIISTMVLWYCLVYMCLGI